MAVQITTNGLITIDGTVIHCDVITYNPNNITTRVSTDGDVSDHSVKCFGGRPVFNFTTKDVDALLTAAGTQGSEVSTVVVFFQNVAANGVRDSTHQSFSLDTGFLVIEGINASQQSVATASATLYPVSSNGRNYPMSNSSSATLPTYAALDSGVLTLGPCTVSGTALEGVESWNLSFGSQVIDDLSDGDLYPQQYNMIQQSPTATITTMNPNQLDSLILTDIGETNDSLGVEDISGTTRLTLLGTTDGITSSTSVTLTLDAASMSTSQPRSASQASVTRQDLMIEIAGGRSSGITVS